MTEEIPPKDPYKKTNDPLEQFPESLRPLLDMRSASQDRKERMFRRILDKYPDALNEEKLRKLAKAWNIDYLPGE